MKSTTLTILLLATTAIAFGQSKPRKIIKHDTIKTIRENISYAPDTIPIYFKEIKPAHPNVFGSVPWEQWVEGFVVWQTYSKNSESGLSLLGLNGVWSYGMDSARYITHQEYDVVPFESSKPIEGIFLYSDKTRVKNPVIYTIKKP